MHGKGEFTYEDGGKLVSNFWKEGEVAGEAEEFDDVGMLAFRGCYEEGLRHGPGIMFFPEGTSLQGIWEEGAISEGVSIFYYPDGSKLEGCWIVCGWIIME